MRNVLGLDHVVILVRELADAEARLARLGFRPTPRGVHSAPMGTANTTVVFANGTYIEALGVLQPTVDNQAVRAVLVEREGPHGLAFKTDDAAAAAAEFAQYGIGPAAAIDFARPVALPSGTREAAFRIARADPGQTPGSWLFVCQHRTPEVTWRDDYLEQPNGVQGVAEVVGVADDLAPLAVAYRRIFGDRLRHEAARLVIETGSARITFLRPDAFADRFAPLGQIAGSAPRLVALGLETSSLDRVRSALSASGSPWVEAFEGSLLVAPEHACGTLIEFTGPKSPRPEGSGPRRAHRRGDR